MIKTHSKESEWSTIFQGPALQRLIKEALANNLDLHIAAQRVPGAQAQVGIARSQQLPSVSSSAGYSALQIPTSLDGTKNDGSPANSFYRGGGASASAAWNLDFWGLYRRQSEAARAELRASEWGQRATRVTLIQSVAESYFELRSLDAQMGSPRTPSRPARTLLSSRSLLSGMEPARLPTCARRRNSSTQPKRTCQTFATRLP